MHPTIRCIPSSISRHLSWVHWRTHIRVIFINFAPLFFWPINIRDSSKCKPVVLYHLKTRMLHGTEIFTYIWLYRKCRWRFQSHGAFGKDRFFSVTERQGLGSNGKSNIIKPPTPLSRPEPDRWWGKVRGMESGFSLWQALHQNCSRLTVGLK